MQCQFLQMLFSMNRRKKGSMHQSAQCQVQIMRDRAPLLRPNQTIAGCYDLNRRDISNIQMFGMLTLSIMNHFSKSKRSFSR
mmetsp:Transcript_1753/g.10798  ORF Transcript_1753/g.10798 Transcript_1753/m.10798 type:complete len:82 (+) Transcript_1753:423-668(+)